ncbi:unnamed protein product [Adineta ricciae]|uniref:Peroxisomal biogenesis factor 11 n=2 Tax=Adineta ricciae TaxID=249248 RepID=A0A814MWY4_ADIRI|nr:unnamed protein product [Adineta ricciae]
MKHILRHNEELICQAHVCCDQFNQLIPQIESLSFEQQFTLAEEDIRQRLFNLKLNKQIGIEQLHRLKTIIEQLQEELHQFRTEHFKNDMYLNCDNTQNSRLNADVKPFEYVPKKEQSNSFSSVRSDDFLNHLFDECAFVTPVHQMSNSKISLDEIIRFTSRTAGRDKIYRTIQYASRFLAWYYIKKRGVANGELFQNIESMMSLTRKGMRLGRFVDYVKSVLESFHIRNKRIGTLFGLIAVCQGLFMFFDNILLLHRYKILHLTNAQRFQQYLYQVWLLWVSCALTRDYYEIQASFHIGQYHQKQDKSLMRQANLFWANKPLVIDTIKNLCDLYIPLSNLNVVRANPGLQGFAGTVSSLLGLLQLWDKSYQLPS